MLNNYKVGFVFVSIVFGFMLAVQFKIVQEPQERDTRDIWQLKADLVSEQQRQTNLLKEISTLESQLSNYKTERHESKEQALRETLEELKKEAGLTEITSSGVILTITPLSDELLLNRPPSGISPELLNRLVNELNQYQAEEISINEQRMINSSVIRDINGVTTIDGYPLDSFPIEVKVIAKDAGNVRDRLKVGKAIEEFFMEDLMLDISEPITSLTIPAYKNTIEVQEMEPVLSDKGDGD